MKNLTVIALFLILSLTFALKVGHQQAPPSSTTSTNGTSPNSGTTNQTKPSANTTSPTTPSTTPTQPAANGTAGPAAPSAPATNPAAANKTGPAASDDLTADEKKEYDAWKSNLIPWAKFENGEDKSAFFNSEVDNKYGQEKKNEIKAKRQKK